MIMKQITGDTSQHFCYRGTSPTILLLAFGSLTLLEKIPMKNMKYNFSCNNISVNQATGKNCHGKIDSFWLIYWCMKDPHDTTRSEPSQTLRSSKHRINLSFQNISCVSGIPRSGNTELSWENTLETLFYVLSIKIHTVSYQEK